MHSVIGGCAAFCFLMCQIPTFIVIFNAFTKRDNNGLRSGNFIIEIIRNILYHIHYIRIT